jgi:hypothetical protein
MKFLSIYRTRETHEPPSQEVMDGMGKLVEEMVAAGKLLATEGCLPTFAGAKVRQDSGKVTVTDGPFAEAKEVVAGFAMLSCDSKAEAIELARRFLSVCGDGECELRQIAEMGDCVSPEAFEAAAAAAAA